MESRLQSSAGPRERLVVRMNTTHSLAAEVPAYAQLQREMHDPRKARPAGTQFPGTGWIAQLVHTVCSVVAPRCDRTGCRQRRSGDALLAQHPEWILPNGDCPTCDSYDARLAELLNVSLAPERAYEHNKASNILREPWGAVAITRSRPSMRPVISVCLRDMLKQER
jgi:hypothetical protein